MILYTRPDPPQVFPSEAIQHAEAELQRSGGTANVGEYWGNYKRYFRVAQHGKCAWCESPDTTETGAVDHYAPRAAVGQLSAPGRELPGLTNVEGRSDQPHLHAPGYWWLTYDWNNWLFGCERCNSAWKKALFPVTQTPHPTPAPGAYTPLLLHPYGPEDPVDHLDVDGFGQIRPWQRSHRGRATIETCGLDRESLRAQRERRVKEAVRWCECVLHAYGSASLVRQAVQALQVMCEDGAPWAAAARATVRRELNLAWSDLKAR